MKHNIIQSQQYGNFGSGVEHYVAARRGYPETVFELLWSRINKRNAEILDLGCGTGISTRPLTQHYTSVVGCDKDERMIQEARKASSGIEYVVASVENLPFRDAQFDVITAFSAFHWFANKEAVLEVKRVLKSGGYFFAVNKYDIGDFKQAYRKIIEGVLQRDLPSVTSTYDPASLLERVGFSNVDIQEVVASEQFTIEQMLQYFQSVGPWGLVPDHLRPKTLALLEDFCRARAVNGIIERALTVRIVSGRIM